MLRDGGFFLDMKREHYDISMQMGEDNFISKVQQLVKLYLLQQGNKLPSSKY
jgi:hypothetical protein